MLTLVDFALAVILKLYNGATNSGPGREFEHSTKQATPTPTPAEKSRPPLYTAWDKADDVITDVTFGVRDCIAFHRYAASVLDVFNGKLAELDAVAFTYAFIGVIEPVVVFHWPSFHLGVDPGLRGLRQQEARAHRNSFHPGRQLDDLLHQRRASIPQHPQGSYGGSPA